LDRSKNAARGFVMFPEYSVMGFCQDRPTPELSFFDLQAEIQQGLPSIAE
jgi:hypothetical protein